MQKADLGLMDAILEALLVDETWHQPVVWLILLRHFPHVFQQVFAYLVVLSLGEVFARRDT